jgi:hypothetical protein
MPTCWWPVKRVVSCNIYVELVFHNAASRCLSVYVALLIFVLCLPFLCGWELAALWCKSRRYVFDKVKANKCSSWGCYGEREHQGWMVGFQLGGLWWNDHLLLLLFFQFDKRGMISIMLSTIKWGLALNQVEGPRHSWWLYLLLKSHQVGRNGTPFKSWYWGMCSFS